ncbi:bifunctional metallophosphatase/5'-nucleotidase [Staphylococcus simiae]|uniref:5'-nucleotidase domain-containing protein n=1 Tax=Staphylococcus simiae CCM 7213 = CCUG 51256 TaxID=911238 RepID=G5JFU7_9STAP|nr:bifunctional UDP-sugar hydrolase/5'-nucleotidase [Staphylococcus simiae]EHJ08940.1 5'-nucleotidase domain-containing protein [Staphylococcus simiae CCM 7213 = CCUG 51256]PNZ11402.1 bifunctional metallophosphatase/5'-nucleotidase [Staphylococcus simiae]SNV66710.1 2,3-cyclic-nucleotide 2-phosphodiesterase [Staphylococcus simiae]
MEKNENINVEIIATSDMHSHFLNGDYGSNIYRAGTYVDQIREHNSNVILLDSGGSLAGSLAAYYYAIVAPYKRHPMIKLMNRMQYDASGVSPSDFKFGLSFLTRSIALARFPWLSANIEYNVTKEPYFSTPYTIKQFDDLRIAIVGVTADGLMENEYAEMEQDVTIEKTLLASKRWIRYIHEAEEPDYLIVIYHGGLDKISDNTTTKKSNSNEAEKLMEEIGVIDLMITAHQHQTIIGENDDTVYVQAGQDAKELVHLSLCFNKRTTTYEAECVESQVINLNRYDESKQLLELTFYDRKAVEYWSQEVVSDDTLKLAVNGLQDLVSQPHPFSQLLHDAIKLAYDNTITCVHVPKNGERGLVGQIRNKDLYEAYPYPDKPIDLTIKGQNIKDILEYSYAHLEFHQQVLSLTIIDETLCTIWQGFNYTIDMERQPFDRVTLYNIDLAKSYRITMTDYCYRNYKNYLAGAIIHHATSDTMSSLIAKLINNQAYQVVVNDNFNIKN